MASAKPQCMLWQPKIWQSVLQTAVTTHAMYASIPKLPRDGDQTQTPSRLLEPSKHLCDSIVPVLAVYALPSSELDVGVKFVLFQNSWGGGSIPHEPATRY